MTKKHPPISLFALQTSEERRHVERLACDLPQSDPRDLRQACRKAGLGFSAAEERLSGSKGSPAHGGYPGMPASVAALPPAANGAGADDSFPAEGRFEFAHIAGEFHALRGQWRIILFIALAAVLAIGVFVGWFGASGFLAQQTAGEQAAASIQTADQELREQNVKARYDSLKEMGVDMDSMDHVDSDEIEAIDVDPVETEPLEELERLADVDVSEGTGKIMDVPIVNQLDATDGGRALMSGCEVASLAMLLRYAGVDVTKEELQDAMPTVALQDKKGRYGNPNKAFVGDMAGSSDGAVGYSVYHGPVAKLAQDYLFNRSFKVVDLTGQSFTMLLKELASGNPCWVIATTTMGPDLVASTWNTADGDIVVNWALHSVLVTGYDDEHIYLNDPYGYERNVACDRDGFEKAWKLMGSQAVTIVPTE